MIYNSQSILRTGKRCELRALVRRNSSKRGKHTILCVLFRRKVKKTTSEPNLLFFFKDDRSKCLVGRSTCYLSIVRLCLSIFLDSQNNFNLFIKSIGISGRHTGKHFHKKERAHYSFIYTFHRKYCDSKGDTYSYI